jgi:hypothetical protein
VEFKLANLGGWTDDEAWTPNSVDTLDNYLEMKLNHRHESYFLAKMLTEPSSTANTLWQHSLNVKNSAVQRSTTVWRKCISIHSVALERSVSVAALCKSFAIAFGLPVQSDYLHNDRQKLFFRAVMRDDVRTLKHLISQGVEVKKMRNAARQSPLQVARICGKAEAAEFLQNYAESQFDRSLIVCEQEPSSSSSTLGSRTLLCIKSKAAEPYVQVVAASAATGGVTVGAGGGAVGLSVGGCVGGALGVVPAVFTFGLSIPVGVVIGSTVGLCTGTAVGGSIGVVGGGVAGHCSYEHRDDIRTAARVATHILSAWRRNIALRVDRHLSS